MSAILIGLAILVAWAILSIPIGMLLVHLFLKPRNRRLGGVMEVDGCGRVTCCDRFNGVL